MHVAADSGPCWTWQALHESKAVYRTRPCTQSIFYSGLSRQIAKLRLMHFRQGQTYMLCLFYTVLYVWPFIVQPTPHAQSLFRPVTNIKLVNLHVQLGTWREGSWVPAIRQWASQVQGVGVTWRNRKVGVKLIEGDGTGFGFKRALPRFQHNLFPILLLQSSAVSRRHFFGCSVVNVTQDIQFHSTAVLLLFLHRCTGRCLHERESNHLCK